MNTSANKMTPPDILAHRGRSVTASGLGLNNPRCPGLRAHGAPETHHRGQTSARAPRRSDHARGRLE